MSTIDTSTWNPDADLNVEIEGIPLNSDAGIAQTWQALRILMAAIKGDGDGIKLSITLKADDNDVVHLSGDELVQGVKTFKNAYNDSTQDPSAESSSIIVRSASYVKGTTPSSSKFVNLLFLDKDGTNIDWSGRLGEVGCAINQNGSVSTRLSCYKNEVVNGSDTQELISVSVGYDASGNKFAIAPSTSSARTYGQDILTRNWIPLDTRIVHSSGNEIISGVKTFSSTISGSINGNAGTASALASSFTIALSGDVSGSVSTDGTGTASIAAAVADDSHNHVISNVDGLQTALDGKAADGSVVHLSGNETVGGTKTFSNGVVFSGSIAGRRSDNSGALVLAGGRDGTLTVGARLQLGGAAYTGALGQFQLSAGRSAGSKVLLGAPDGTLTWDGQAIQTASDERIKTHLASVPDEVLDAWGDIGWGQFQFLEAVEEKGDSARLHLGLIAQKVKAAFEARGLDACAYGILCHEVRPAMEEAPAVDLWMVRYTEALAMEAAFQRRRADRLEARIAALEERLNG